MPLTYIDIFAGAGGLSEGFVRNGHIPVAHVEMNKEACLTLKTRTCYYYLKANNRLDDYYRYLKKKSLVMNFMIWFQKRYLILSFKKQ